MANSFNPLSHRLLLNEPEFLTDIESWQEHIPFAFYLTEILQPRSFVELGVFKGDSYCAFCQAISALNLGTRAYGVDTWAGDKHAGFYTSVVLDELQKHHDPRYHRFSRLLQTTFDEAAESFAAGSIDLLHIDGLHTYEAVRHDFETWLPKLSDRAVVIFHDTNVRHGDFGVWRFWSEVVQQYPGFDFVHGNGLGVLAVGTAVNPEFLAFIEEAKRENSNPLAFFAEFGRRILLSGREQRLTHEVQILRDEIAKARYSFETLSDELHRLRAKAFEADALRKETDALKKEAHNLRRFSSDQERALHQARTDLSHRSSQVAAMLASTSWRLTAPIRAFGRESGRVKALLPLVVRGTKAVVKNPRLLLTLAKQGHTTWQRSGVSGVVSAVKKRLAPQSPAQTATPNIRRAEIQSSDAAARMRMRAAIDGFALRPTISIIMPVYNTPIALLNRAVESVRAQAYVDWELCIADDGSPNADVARHVQQLPTLDSRIKVTRLEQNAGISGASNRALELATGDFVAFLDHDDELTDRALFECIAALNSQPDLDVLYSDEAKIDMDNQLLEPVFKPDWSPELFRGVMYVGHFLCARRSIVHAAGGFLSAFDGVQDYELMLRMSELTPRIRHIAKILYCWRAAPGSIAAASDAKSNIEQRQAAAVRAHLDRLGIASIATSHPTLPHRVILKPAARSVWPLVSIVIPSKDAPDYIGRCLQSIFGVSTYPNIEVIVVDNATTDPAALAILQQHPIRIVPFNERFNFSRAVNAGVAAATGDYVVLLNNDTEVVTPDWLQTMVSLFDAKDVGAVGTLLLYPDRTVQHAGVVLGARGTADHVMRGFPSDVDGYAGSLSCTREVSAATAACLMVPRALYHEFGGLSVDYRTIYQDVDLCLKLRSRGYRVLCTPRAVLIHYESVSRGTAYDAFDRALLLDVWGDTISAGDPYYNAMLSLETCDYTPL